MTPEEAEAAHERYMEIADEITKLVNERTKDMNESQDTYIRQVLSDTQRYWKE